MIKVYHGSDVEVREVDLVHSQMFKDFGPGFYVSKEMKQAVRFANTIYLPYTTSSQK